MWRQVLRDPLVRRVYLTTKLGVVAVAALVTWPLAQAIGPKAWIGYGVFALLMAALTAAVLALGAGPEDVDSGASDDDAPPQDDEPEPADPDMPIEIPIEDALDLHPFPPKDVPDVVAAYLEAAHERGLAEVRLIHGRGIGVQRERVRSLLAKSPLVIEFSDATPDRGGWGATIARLTPR